ncbi:hypothetical protein KR067_006659, partial [Drosophila pandora]
MRIYTDRRQKAAILVDHQDVICMPMEPLSTDYGVCFDTELEPYLRYMDAVLLQASRTPAILGLDANAASPMWFSKLPRNPEGHANYNRGELLSEWMLENGAVALNQPSPVFTFDTYRARSDIDVTIANDAASMWATFEWRVESGIESLAPVPSWNISNARWQLFEQEMVSRAADIPEDFSQSPLDQQVLTLRGMVHDACDLAMRRRTPRSPRRRKPGWWTASLRSGFLQGRCVDDAWRHVKSCVAASPARYVLGIFVDFKGAFDNVEWSAALRWLADLRCRVLSLWQSFFSDRRAEIRSSSGTVSVPVTRGYPQRSFSGPFIWDLLMDVLLRRLQPYCALSAYADDLLLLVKGNSRAEDKGAQLMSIAEAWGTEIGVTISTSKTVIMLLKGAFARTPLTGMDRYIQIKRKLSPLNSKRKITRGNASLAAKETPINSNRFKILADADEVEAVESTEVGKKKPKPPPIYIREKSSNVLVNKIIELIGKDNFHIIPLVKGNIQETKVQMKSEDNYRVLSKYLTENKKNFYTYQLKSSKGLQVVLKGIEPEVTPEEIKKALQEKGFSAKTVFNILNRDRKPQPLFKVELEPETKLLKKYEVHPIYNLQYLLHRR